MPRLTTYSDHLTDWQLLLTGIADNEGDLPQLAIQREKLQSFLSQALARVNTQAVHAAAKQLATSELVALIEQGSRLATVLRGSVREHYGSRSEKLTEFHIQPFRGRKKAAVVVPPVYPEASAPGE